MSHEGTSGEALQRLCYKLFKAIAILYKIQNLFPYRIHKRLKSISLSNAIIADIVPTPALHLISLYNAIIANIVPTPALHLISLYNAIIADIVPTPALHLTLLYNAIIANIVPTPALSAC